METQYLIDCEDKIVSVGGEWDAFAKENNAETAMSENVIGKSVWNFISDSHTADYMREVFMTCRSRRSPMHMFYRCDSPEVKRLFKFSALADAQDNILVGNTLMPTAYNLLGPKLVTPFDEFDVNNHTCCASCHALKYKDTWVDLFPMEGESEVGVNYTICSKCAQKAAAA